MTLFTSLDAAQQAQAAYLFADDVFGTDVNAYEYELEAGKVIGRARLAANSSPLNAHVRKPRTISVNVCTREVPAEMVTVEMDRNANYAIQSIARNIAARLIQSQTVEA